MNELKLLREWDADAPPLTDTVRARARFRLYQAMRAPAAPTTVRRRPLLRIAVAAVAAAAVTATVVVAENTGTSPRTQTVSTATVLRGAAAEERRLEKPIAPRDDQFIYTKEITKETPVGGGRSKTYVDESWSSVDGSKKSYVSELGHTQWVPPDQPGQSSWPPRRWSQLKQLPTEPGKLPIALRDIGRTPDYDRPMKADEWPMVQLFLSGLLRTPVLPKGLRPAAFEALATVPGVKVLPGRTDADGRAGIGIQYVGKPGTPWAEGGPVLVFDAKTYQYLGMRDQRNAGAETYEQWSYVAADAVVDRVMQRP
ncbi:CU044_5270 family protein [Streptomyces swartbergensis]|uniref:Tat pathway signal protein n=1 Tax=Streptomyces swartbergensis TaxID=487165 RepID=A0A243S8N6_9ACTN|nr:CU044_5270 family protein [Streptomyces swartbergensis]OUD04037.1 Tat pathway signal protein [Streptomyces swartbergensis]